MIYRACLTYDLMFLSDPFLPFLPPNIPSNSRWAKVMRNNWERDLRKRQARIAAECQRTTARTNSQGLFCTHLIHS